MRIDAMHMECPGSIATTIILWNKGNIRLYVQPKRIRYAKYFVLDTLFKLVTNLQNM